MHIYMCTGDMAIPAYHRKKSGGGRQKNKTNKKNLTNIRGKKEQKSNILHTIQIKSKSNKK